MNQMPALLTRLPIKHGFSRRDDKLMRSVKRKSGPKGDGWPFGRSVYQSEIHAVIDNVDGVDYVTQLALRASGSAQYQNGNVRIAPLQLAYSGQHSIQITR